MPELTTVEVVRRRLADGRTIADGDVHKLVKEIDRLRERLREYNPDDEAFDGEKRG